MNAEEMSPTTSIPNPVVRAGWMMAAAFALLLIGFLALGFVLPGTWSARASLLIDVSSERVFATLAEPRRWDDWMPWPEVQFSYEGPSRGIGARRRWDDTRFGAGAFTITEAESPRLLRYEVLVDGGDLVTLGVLRLETTASGTLVTWEESGDFGWNPLLAYAALGMENRQRTELERSLERLAGALEGR